MDVLYYAVLQHALTLAPSTGDLRNYSFFPQTKSISFRCIYGKFQVILSSIVYIREVGKQKFKHDHSALRTILVINESEINIATPREQQQQENCGIQTILILLTRS